MNLSSDDQLREIYIAMCRKKFQMFNAFAFETLHPGEFFYEMPYIRYLCGALEVATEAEMIKVVVNAPPRYLKTHICSVALPCWILGRNPGKEIMIISESFELARDIQDQCLALMQSPRYRSIFPWVNITHSDKEIKLSIGGGIRHSKFGQGARFKKSDAIIIDNPESAFYDSEKSLMSIQNMPRMLKDPKTGLIVLNTRRVGEDDLTAQIHSRIGGWIPLVFPVVSEKEYIYPEIPGAVDAYEVEKGIPLNLMLESPDDIYKHLDSLGRERFFLEYMQEHREFRDRGVIVVDMGTADYEIPDKLPGINPARDVLDELFEGWNSVKAAY